MPFKKKDTAKGGDTYTVNALRTGVIHFRVIGTSPLIYNAVSLKAKQTLLNPRAGKMSTAEKATNLKHDPMTEYRSSVYAFRDNQAARLFFPGGGFKKSLQNSAKHIEGIFATTVAQLTWVKEHDVSIFGIPQLYMTVVRSADMSRTPDIRTRAILSSWAACFTLNYVQPQLSDVSVVNLLTAAGLLCGIGDGRQEKGYGHGQFRIVSSDDKADVKAYENLLKGGGRKAQDAALLEPTMYDLETEELFAWYKAEMVKHGDRHKRGPVSLVKDAGTEKAA